MPDFVPRHREVIWPAGSRSCSARPGFSTRRPAGSRAGPARRCWSGVYPANLKMAGDALKTDNQKFQAVALGRLPLQIPLIRSALRATRRAKPIRTTRSARSRVAATTSALAWSETRRPPDASSATGRAPRAARPAAEAEVLRRLDVPDLVEQRAYAGPAAALVQQVVALGDDDPVLRPHRDRAGHRLLALADELRCVDGLPVSSRRRRSSATYPSTSKVSGAPLRSLRARAGPARRRAGGTRPSAPPRPRRPAAPAATPTPSTCPRRAPR